MGRTGLFGRRGLTQRKSRQGQRGRGSVCELMEQLEPRLVLSDTYFAYVEVETLPGYNANFPLFGQGEIVGASDDGRYMWPEGAADDRDNDSAYEPFLIVDGQVRYLIDIDGLDGIQIGGINSDGLMFAKDIEGVDEGRLFLFDLTGDGVREYLDAADLDTPIDFDLAAVSPVTITDNGFLFVKYTTPFNEGDLTHFWTIHEQQVEFMWAGTLVDVNASGMALGYELGRHEEVNLSRGHGEPLLWMPETSSAFSLTDVGFSTISDIDDDGWILGTHGVIVIDAGDGDREEPFHVGDHVVLWRDGETQMLGYSYSRETDGSHIYYTTGSRDRDGRFQLTESHVSYFDNGDWTGYDGPSETRFIDSAGEARFQGFLPERGSLMPSGIILDNQGWWEQVDLDEFFAVLPGEAVAVWSEDGIATVWTTTTRKKGVLFHLDGNGAVATSFDAAPGWLRTEVLVSLTNNRVFVIGQDGERIRYYDPADNDKFTEPSRGRYDIVNIAPYMRMDGTLAVAYTDSLGSLSIAYGRYEISRLSQHLSERGLETPQFVSKMVGFQTRWRGQNIVGLDASGDVQAVWWSPGLGSPLWTTSNLSAITGAPKLVGELTAAATPWGGMQVMGTDEQGHVVSLWWSPKTGRWQVTDLTAQVDGPTLEAGSLRVQTGRWGSITLVGKSTEGDVVTYWWSPAGGWQVESLTEEAGRDTPLIAGNVSYFADPTGEQHVAGVTAAGHVIDLYWKPDGHGWQWQDLTALAMG